MQPQLSELIARITDNTQMPSDYEKLGILQFGKLLFPEYFGQSFSRLHYDICQLYFQLANAKKYTPEFKSERQAYVLAHREAAKSTIDSFLIPIYAIYMKGVPIQVRRYKDGWAGSGMAATEIVEHKMNEDFIIIASETATQSESFIMDIKAAIDNRHDLAEIFGEKNPAMIELDEQTRKQTKKWTNNAFITADNTVVWGVGSGQRIRGRKVLGKRPSLLIVDDMYSRQNTKTEATRESLNNWFFAEAINSVSSENGKTLWVGTMVHPDIVVKQFRKDPDWIGVERPLIAMEHLHIALKKCVINDDVDSAKALALQPSMDLSWPEFHNLPSVLKKYLGEKRKGQLNYFYQEYMNEPFAPEMTMFTNKNFCQSDITFRQDQGQQWVEFVYEGRQWKGVATLHIGVDPASSISSTSDDTVITVGGFARCYPYAAGMDWQTSVNSVVGGKIFPIIAHIEGGKYSIYDYQGLPGICEATVRLCNQFKITSIKIEINGQQEQIAREVKRTQTEDKWIQDGHRMTKIQAQGVMVWTEFHSVNKSERILSILSPITQNYKTFICQPNTLIDKLLMQLVSCGISDHDDYPDSLSMTFKSASVPNVIMDDYYEQLSYHDGDRALQELQETLGTDYWYYT